MPVPMGAHRPRFETFQAHARTSRCVPVYRQILGDDLTPVSAYRRLAQAHGKARRDVDDEHTALVRATLDRDAERACALLTEHIAKTTERVLAAHPGLRAGAPAPEKALPTKSRSSRSKD